MAEHFAYIIADTENDAHDLFRNWTLAGQEERRLYESWNIVFKGEADARHLLARHLQEAKPGQRPRIWQFTIFAHPLDVAPSVTGIPPYAEGDIITVYDRRLGEQYRAEVTECLLGGAHRPWLVSFESLKPVQPNDPSCHLGSLEASDDGSSPHIIKENA
jgi:hypothetical protein